MSWFRCKPKEGFYESLYRDARKSLDFLSNAMSDLNRQSDSLYKSTKALVDQNSKLKRQNSNLKAVNAELTTTINEAILDLTAAMKEPDRAKVQEILRQVGININIDAKQIIEFMYSTSKVEYDIEQQSQKQNKSD